MVEKLKIDFVKYNKMVDRIIETTECSEEIAMDLAMDLVHIIECEPNQEEYELMTQVLKNMGRIE